MSIQIDPSLFLPKIKKYAERHSHSEHHEEASIGIARAAVDVAQEWFDDQPWTKGLREDFDTQRECRIDMKRFVMERLDPSDEKKHWFIPDFLWIWLASRVISYVIKLIIEHYWPDLITEMKLDY